MANTKPQQQSALNLTEGTSQSQGSHNDKEPTVADTTKKSPHSGHRDRLRERFLKSPDALPDYELLELLLFMAIPRRDVKPIAKILIERFKDLKGVLNAGSVELQGIKGISETTAIAIKVVQVAGLRMLKQDMMSRPILNSWQRLVDYCQAAMANESKEHFRLLFLNKKNEVIADEVQQTGTVDHTPAYPREIIKRALELGATAIILVHNHPSGDPSPSQADIQLTQTIINAAQPFEIVIHDHLIVSRNGTTSFKNLGLI